MLGIGVQQHVFVLLITFKIADTLFKWKSVAPIGCASSINTLQGVLLLPILYIYQLVNIIIKLNTAFKLLTF